MLLCRHAVHRFLRPIQDTVSLARKIRQSLQETNAQCGAEVESSVHVV